MLTETQERLYYSIKDYIDEYGYSPVIRELLEPNGVKSTASIHYGLTQLKKKGYIDYVYNRDRTIRIIKDYEGSSKEFM